MTFNEWYEKKYMPLYEGHAMEDWRIAEMAWKAAQEESRIEIEALKSQLRTMSETLNKTAYKPTRSPYWPKGMK